MTDYPTDAERLTRLAEEVQGRLEEMARIAARIAGVTLEPGMVRKFAPRPESESLARVAASGHGHVTMVEILGDMCATWWSDGTVGLDSPCGHEIYHSH